MLFPCLCAPCSPLDSLYSPLDSLYSPLGGEPQFFNKNITAGIRAHDLPLLKTEKPEVRGALPVLQLSPISAEMISIRTAGTSMPNAMRNTMYSASFSLTAAHSLSRRRRGSCEISHTIAVSSVRGLPGARSPLNFLQPSAEIHRS